MLNSGVTISLRFALVLTFLCLSLLLSFGAQEGSLKAPIVLKHADSLIGVQLGNVEMRRFVGNVQFQQKDVYLRCDEAIHYIGENKAELIGDVTVTQGETIIKSPLILFNGNENVIFAPKGVFLADSKQQMFADTGFYYTNTNVAEFFGNVKIIENQPRLTCNYVFYDRKTRFSLAKGNVRAEDDSIIIFCDVMRNFSEERITTAKSNVVAVSKTNNMILTCDSVIYYREYNQVRAFGSPVIYQIDSTQIRDSSESALEEMKEEGTSIVPKGSNIYRYDTLSVSAESISFLSSEGIDRYIFEKNVEIVSNNVLSRSDYAFYNKQENYIILVGNSIIWYDSTQIHSDSIIVFIEGNKLRRIMGFGNSIALSRSDTTNVDKIDQISGKNIEIEFSNDSIIFIRASGDAKSLYFLVSEGGGEGAARNFCDTIIVYFSENKAERIDWLGAVIGEFFPEELVLISAKEYYLPGFRLSDNKPRKRFLQVKRSN